MGLAGGLRDVVRAGGSATKTVGTLAGYVKDSLNPGGDGNNPESMDREEKNRPR